MAMSRVPGFISTRATGPCGREGVINKPTKAQLGVSVVKILALSSKYRFWVPCSEFHGKEKERDLASFVFVDELHPCRASMVSML